VTPAEHYDVAEQLLADVDREWDELDRVGVFQPADDPETDVAMRRVQLTLLRALAHASLAGSPSGDAKI
jgi:hypothetical protein